MTHFHINPSQFVLNGRGRQKVPFNFSGNNMHKEAEN